MHKPFSPVRNLKKGFVGEGSSPGYTGRTFKGFVDFFILFLRLWTYLDAFRHLRNLFWGFGKTPLFLQCKIVLFSDNTHEIYYKQTKENITYSNIKTNLKEPKPIKLLINIYKMEQSIYIQLSVLRNHLFMRRSFFCNVLSMQHFVLATICPCDIFFATFYPCNYLSMQHFVRNDISATFCLATFSPSASILGQPTKNIRPLNTSAHSSNYEIIGVQTQ